MFVWTIDDVFALGLIALMLLLFLAACALVLTEMLVNWWKSTSIYRWFKAGKKREPGA